ncbi:MAG: hypothetical protein HRU18_11955 [Pseudoalteromonas sp.]|uniref:hypothetical protein n=1 Tax=Pseudoalteromonas sp. TaxID=53249 RepID=UPI001DBCF081|nr:hypothetical protein [Pseudoalteromonas sp.]NRA78915.1 hypothetical protein [Pseudoalteromonas sp.]
MIKSQELRIGNFLLNSGNGQEFRLDFQVLEMIHRKRGWFTGIKRIPLTQDWLFKFGFEYVTMGIFNMPNTTFSVIKWSGENCYYESNDKKGSLKQRVELEHVHQLQNLYFALTGKELELSKP